MRLLLDSHVVLWWLAGDSSIGSTARRMVERADQVFVSAATPWELGIKRALGKLAYPDDLVESIERSGFNALPITLDHAVLAPELPPHHRDPFDRMLIAQATTDALTLVTADEALSAYGIDVLDARA